MKFKKLSLILIALACSSCTMRNTTKAEFTFDTNYALSSETSADNSEQWFVHGVEGTTIYFGSGNLATLHLVYLDSSIKDLTCRYYLPYIGEPYSSIGTLTLNNETIELIFDYSFYIKFKLPVSLNPIGKTGEKNLEFKLSSGK